MGPNGRVETNLDCWKRAGPQRDCFRWLPQRRNRYVCSVLRLSFGPKDESSVVLTAGNALAAHTRNEIHSEDKKQYVTVVSLLLTGPNGRVVISLDCWKRAGRTHSQRDLFRWPRHCRNHYVCSVWWSGSPGLTPTHVWRPERANNAFGLTFLMVCGDCSRHGHQALRPCMFGVRECPERV